MRSFERTSKGICNVCGRNTFTKCTICNLHCCFKDGPQMASVSCSVDLHNEKFFGLLKCDRRSIFGETVRSYRKPTVAEWRKNLNHIKKHQKKYYEEYIME